MSAANLYRSDYNFAPEGPGLSASSTANLPAAPGGTPQPHIRKQQVTIAGGAFGAGCVAPLSHPHISNETTYQLMDSFPVPIIPLPLRTWYK